MSERATLRDVAKLAEVSLGTASQALSNKPGVAPDTRARVLQAAVDLGYQHQIRVATPTAYAISTVGMLMKRAVNDQLPINPFYSYVLSGAERECQRRNLSLMYAHVEVDEQNRAQNWPPMLLNQRADGLLVVGAFLEETIIRISQQTQQKIVLVDSYAPDQLFDSIVTDNINGAYNAVRYLIDRGHSRIGCVGSMPAGYPSIRERRKGYTRALKEAGITDLYIEDSLLTREDVYDATIRLLRRSPEITAIFACNDNAAIGALNAINDLGLRVPDDISLVGFDDIDLAQEVSPALTTIHVDKTLMGVLAVRQLLERAENPDRPALTIALSTQLLERESVRSL
jgi:LacI family transcriptional regulator